MTAVLTNADGSLRVVFDGQIVVGEGIGFGPLPNGKAWIDARAGSGDGMGGYPAAYYQALENATGLLGVEHIEPGGDNGVLLVNTGVASWGLIMDANVSSVAAIAGSKIAELDDVPGTLDASKLYGAATLTGLDVDGSIEAGGNLIAGGHVNAGVSGVNLTNLLSLHAPLFNIPVDATVCTNLDADKLDGEHGYYYQNADNLTSGTVDLARGGTNTDNSSQSANLVFASPSSGGTGAMSVRALVSADIPLLSASKISDFVATARTSISVADGTNIDLSYDSATGVVTASISGQLGLGNMPRAAAGKVLRGAGTGADPAYSTLTIPDTVANQDLIVATSANTLGVVAKPSSTSVLTHDGSAYAWAAALAKAQQHAQTAYLDAAQTFTQGQRYNAPAAYGNTIDASTGLRMNLAGTFTGTTQLGIFADPVFQSGATVAARSMIARFRTAAASFTCPDGAALYVQNASLGASSVVTRLIGLDIETISGGGTNWSIRTGTAKCEFGGAVSVGTDLTMVSPTTATTATAGANALPANPVGFLVVSIAGTSRKIPYYAT